MTQFPQGTRSLYLLALFQLVGGPVVLLTLMMFSKIAVKNYSANEGVKAGVVKIFQSTEWKTFAVALHESTPSDSKSKTPLLPEAKDTKLNLVSVLWSQPQVLPIIIFQELTHRHWDPDASSVLPHEPPSPPPKLA